MPDAARILASKQSGVISVSSAASVLEAAQVMNEHHIGSLVVIDDEKLVGIFSERDVMRRVVAANLDPRATSVADVMTKQVACASSHTTTDELRNVMRNKRIRHIPVLDGTEVLGMISIGDLNRSEREVQQETILYLEQYMSMP